MMDKKFNRVRLVVVQPEESVYFDKYYTDGLMAMDKFSYFCKLAKVNNRKAPGFEFKHHEKYTEITSYFPENEGNVLNQSGFVQVSLYFELY